MDLERRRLIVCLCASVFGHVALILTLKTDNNLAAKISSIEAAPIKATSIQVTINHKHAAQDSPIKSTEDHQSSASTTTQKITQPVLRNEKAKEKPKLKNSKPTTTSIAEVFGLTPNHPDKSAENRTATPTTSNHSIIFNDALKNTIRGLKKTPRKSDPNELATRLTSTGMIVKNGNSCFRVTQSSNLNSEVWSLPYTCSDALTDEENFANNLREAMNKNRDPIAINQLNKDTID